MIRFWWSFDLNAASHSHCQPVSPPPPPPRCVFLALAVFIRLPRSLSPCPMAEGHSSGQLLRMNLNHRVLIALTTRAQCEEELRRLALRPAHQDGALLCAPADDKERRREGERQREWVQSSWRILPRADGLAVSTATITTQRRRASAPLRPLWLWQLLWACGGERARARTPPRRPRMVWCPPGHNFEVRTTTQKFRRWRLV